MMAELEPERPDSIVVGIFYQQIREVREKQRPDLPAPLSPKDDFVRQVIKSLGSTDFEKTLGRRINDLESSLRYAKEPQNLRDEFGYAHYYLGRCYEEGVGVRRNLHVAWLQYKIADDKGHPGAKEAIERIFLLEQKKRMNSILTHPDTTVR